jgi:hypothetical protein
VDCQLWDDGLNQMILAKEFTAAFEKFYAEHATLQENLDEPRLGRAANLAREKQFLESVERVDEVLLVSSAAEGMRSLSEWIYGFTFKNGKSVKMHEVAARQWKDGLVVHERFYHNRQM